jgi:ribose/xylose/arabinose/galactoside ABC-type transport system permease subunit
MPQQIFIYRAPKSPHLPLPLDICSSGRMGSLFGLLSGFLSHRFRVHSFIITLCIMIFTRGLAVSYTHGQPLFGMPDPVSYLAYGLPARIPMPTIIWLGSSLLCLLFLRYTRFGRGIYAVGGGEEAARLSGIQPAWYRIFPYVASGFFAALVGIMMSGRMGCGDPDRPGLGAGCHRRGGDRGTSLTGARAPSAHVVGVLIMGLIINIMNLLEIEAYPQAMAKGIIIIAALALHSLLARRRKG